eukprot:1425597-Prorocentrum_lima.AAC.1
MLAAGRTSCLGTTWALLDAAVVLLSTLSAAISTLIALAQQSPCGRSAGGRGEEANKQSQDTRPRRCKKRPEKATA